MSGLKDIQKHWETAVSSALVGKKIVNIRFQTATEAKKYGWNQKAVVIELDDGTTLIPSRDDEGNGAGSIFTNLPKLSVIPVLF